MSRLRARHHAIHKRPFIAKLFKQSSQVRVESCQLSLREEIVFANVTRVVRRSSKVVEYRYQLSSVWNLWMNIHIISDCLEAFSYRRCSPHWLWRVPRRPNARPKWLPVVQLLRNGNPDWMNAGIWYLLTLFLYSLVSSNGRGFILWYCPYGLRPVEYDEVEM
jgi:hypothetical protein